MECPQPTTPHTQRVDKQKRITPMHSTPSQRHVGTHQEFFGQPENPAKKRVRFLTIVPPESCNRCPDPSGYRQRSLNLGKQLKTLTLIPILFST